MMVMWGLALVLATVATTIVLQRKLTRGRGPEPDTIFWDAFAGLVVVVPAIVVPAVTLQCSASRMAWVSAAVSGTRTSDIAGKSMAKAGSNS